MNDAGAAGLPTYVVGDVHGHREGLTEALLAKELVDADGDWAGGKSRVWFLGDFVDRGPDGVGVIDLVMRLQEQAAEAGGEVHSLLGNHEILLLGMHRFGDTEVPSDFGPRSFGRSWEINGGQPSDQEKLTGRHIEWLVRRPLLAHAENYLLMHSDTLEYLEWGADVEEINQNVAEVLAADDISDWWEVWRRMTTRYAFRGPNGPEIAQLLLERLGGERIVHGHSVIADQLGIHPAQIEAPYLYAGGKVLGVDGGLFVGGPCLIVPLPWEPED
ncbi:metallophosphoesterase family protein [Amycolatopsis sp. YIM 10]|uniref:metallophosphoesterase family protein n=1 Tax=Amycolatopsis sp. YIM 10 TaxID=2653857 RepID=UPI00128FE576|nr:metallophosphoesterase family protein [Amycolatopsis sp. YIM 10]QFU85937.1 diadenosine tetraphosphatase [Amycolatopsis sp. YIM 10]